MRPPGGGLAAPLSAGLIAFAVYVKTALPGVAYGDWGEMQTVPHVLGIAHPTGYPTYILLAWAAQLVPIGSIAFRSNVLSAALVAATLAGVVAILQRLEVRPLIAVGTALALGAAGTVWAAATVAEVNPLHLFLMTMLTFLAVRWADGFAPRDLVLGGLVIGLSVGNHLLTLFVAPFLVAYVLWVGRAALRRHLWLLPAAVGAGALGLSVYLYIPLAALRDPPLAYNHPVDLDSFLWLVTGAQFRYQFDLFSPKAPVDFVANLPLLAGTLAQGATPVLPILGFIGLADLVLRRRALGITLVATLITGFFVWATYQRLEHYLLVPLLILGIGAAVALDALTDVLRPLARRFGRDIPPTAAVPVVGIVTLVFALGVGLLNWNAADRSGDHAGDDYVSTVFAALPANAAVISYWDPTAPLWYGRYVEGLRPDVLIVDDSNIVYEHWGDTVFRIGSLVCERPVFVMRTSDLDLAPIRQDYRLTKFLTVRSSALGPTAVLDQVMYRVERPASCP